jgi:hypothetical protein
MSRNTVAMVSAFQLQKAASVSPRHHRSVMNTTSKRGFSRSYVGADEQTWQGFITDLAKAFKDSQYFGVLLSADPEGKLRGSQVDEMAAWSTLEKFADKDAAVEWYYNLVSLFSAAPETTKFIAIFDRNDPSYPNPLMVSGSWATDWHDVPKTGGSASPSAPAIPSASEFTPPMPDYARKSEGINPAVAGILVGLGGITLASIFGK